MVFGEYITFVAQYSNRVATQNAAPRRPVITKDVPDKLPHNDLDVHRVGHTKEQVEGLPA